MTFEDWWKKNGIEQASYAEKSAARKGWEAGVAAEREEIMDEWAMCVQSDLEHGVKLLNEKASDEFKRKYPAMFGFAEAIYTDQKQKLGRG